VLVPGRSDNLKLTTSQDREVMEAILRSRRGP